MFKLEKWHCIIFLAVESRELIKIIDVEMWLHLSCQRKDPCGISGLATGMAISIDGDTGVRENTQQG